MISGLLSTPQSNSTGNSTTNNIVRNSANYQMLSRVNSILDQFNEATIKLQESAILSVNEASGERLENNTIAQYLENFSTEITKLAQSAKK